MSIDNTSFSIRGGIFNNKFALTSIPEKQQDPHGKNIVVGVPHETSFKSWIWRSTNYHTINYRSRTSMEIPPTCDGITKSESDDET